MTDFGRRTGDMKKSVYDTDGDGVVDDSEKLESETLAQVQDHTPKTHTHTEAQITDLDHNAKKIKGCTVDDTDKGNTKVLAYNATSGNLEYEAQPVSGPADAIRGDGTANRYLREGYLWIEDGSNANTLKCGFGDAWNGDYIAETDNIAKNATTGHFTLNSLGTVLWIETAGLSGNVVMAICSFYLNAVTGIHIGSAIANDNKIRIIIRDNPGVDALDLTDLVDSGWMEMDILYLTDA